MIVTLTCVRCGRQASAQAYLVNEYEYTGHGFDTPPGWEGAEYCGDPCVPSSWNFHGPWPERRGEGSASSIIQAAYADYVLNNLAPVRALFPTVPVDKPTTIKFKRVTR